MRARTHTHTRIHTCTSSGSRTSYHPTKVKHLALRSHHHGRNDLGSGSYCNLGRKCNAQPRWREYQEPGGVPVCLVWILSLRMEACEGVWCKTACDCHLYSIHVNDYMLARMITCIHMRASMYARKCVSESQAMDVDAYPLILQIHALHA